MLIFSEHIFTYVQVIIDIFLSLFTALFHKDLNDDLTV